MNEPVRDIAAIKRMFETLLDEPEAADEPQPFDYWMGACTASLHGSSIDLCGCLDCRNVSEHDNL